ncbi:hypothetical protein NY08_4611 [Rhodococcus sp. B7740]|nr:hypothetical protein NY08_4611 [Rhodococcus sp. B7740]
MRDGSERLRVESGSRETPGICHVIQVTFACRHLCRGSVSN